MPYTQDYKVCPAGVWTRVNDTIATKCRLVLEGSDGRLHGTTGGGTAPTEADGSLPIYRGVPILGDVDIDTMFPGSGFDTLWILSEKDGRVSFAHP